MAFGIVFVCTTNDTPQIWLSAGTFKRSLALVIYIKTHESVDDYPSLFSLAQITRLGYPFFKRPPHTFTHPPSLTSILIYVSNTSSSSSSNTTSNPSNPPQRATESGSHSPILLDSFVHAHHTQAAATLFPCPVVGASSWLEGAGGWRCCEGVELFRGSGFVRAGFGGWDFGVLGRRRGETTDARASGE